MLGGHEVLLDAFNTDVRPACAEARVALGAAENPIRALRESGYAARMATERETRAGADPMSTVTPIIDHVEDLWPAEACPSDTLGQLVLASHLLGANRAVSNFGGGNTSAKGVDGRPRRAARSRRCGSRAPGSDLATMGPEHFTGAASSTRCCR